MADMTRNARIVSAAQKLNSASSRLVELLDDTDGFFDTEAATRSTLKGALTEVAEALTDLGVGHWGGHRSLFVRTSKDLDELVLELDDS